MQQRFTLEYWIDDGWYIGKLQEVPGVFSQGESLDELEANIQDVYALVMEDQRAKTPAGSKTKDITLEVA